MKKIPLVFLLTLIFYITAGAAPIFKYEKVTPVTDSITLTKVEEFHSDSNITYSYIKADLADEHTSLELLKSQNGTDIIETVKTLAQTEENTVAALNADFFSVYSGVKGFALGMEIKDGKLLQSPINPGTMATVFYDSEKAAISYLDFHIMAVAPNWQYHEIRHLNKHTSYYGDILMYTSDFNGGMSPAPGGEVVEVVVSDGKIVEFRRNLPPVKIPEDGCVLVVSEGINMFLANNFAVGDEIKFDYYITPDMENVKTAFGGGAVLVSEGKAVTEYSHTVAGLNPRSAVGIDESGKTLYLVAVDGRQESSAGMRMSQLADLLVSLGCYSAVNLDGGGSTNLVASTVWQSELHTVNSPSQYNRKVINAVGLTYDKEVGEPAGILVESEKTLTFVGQPVKVSAVLHDESFRQVSVDAEIEWFTTHGKVESGYFYPEREGVAVIEASCGDVFAETEIQVVDTVSGIVTDGYIYLTPGMSKELEISVFDSHGNYVDITNTEPFIFTSSNPKAASVADGIITAHSDGTAVISVAKDDAISYISVAVGTYAAEHTESFEGKPGYTVVYPSDVKGTVGISAEMAFSGNSSGKISFDFKDEPEELPEAMTDESDTVEQTEEQTEEQSGEQHEEQSEEQTEEQNVEQPEPKPDVAKAVYYRFDNKAFLHNNESAVKLKFFTENDFHHELRAQLIDGNGESLLITFEGSYEKESWQELIAYIPEDVPRPVMLRSIYVLYRPGEEKDEGAVYIDNLRYNIAKKTELVSAPHNEYDFGPVRRSGSSFAVGALTIGGDILSDMINALTFEKVNEADSGVFTGHIDGYSSYEDENSLVVRLDTSGGGIRATDFTQWDKLTSAINGSEKQNVFILSNSLLFGNNDLENRVICDYLASVEKNVFVITGGERNTYANIDGVDYFTLRNSRNTTDYGNPDNYRYLEFYIGKKVYFEFKALT